MAKVNTGRLIQGGLLAGLVINVICFLGSGLVWGKKIMAEQQAGHFLTQPRFPFAPAWVVLMFVMGFALVWLYAAVRPRLGPGPRTAITVGIVAGIISALPDNLANAAWGVSGRYLPTMWIIERIVAFTLGSLVGAWRYKEPDA